MNVRVTCRLCLQRQVVWAEFKEFGCSIVKCPFVAKGEHLKKDWRKAVMVACDYGPG